MWYKFYFYLKTPLVGTLNLKKTVEGRLVVDLKKKQIENGPTEEDFVIIILN